MTTGAKSPASGERMRARDLTERVVELRTPAVGEKAPSYREIVDILEDETGHRYSVSTVQQAVWRGVALANDRIADKAGERRDAANEELLQLVEKLWDKFDRESDPEVCVKVAGELRKNNESRRRLYGLDGPVKVKLEDDRPKADLSRLTAEELALYEVLAAKMFAPPTEGADGES